MKETIKETFSLVGRGHFSILVNPLDIIYRISAALEEGGRHDSAVRFPAQPLCQ